MAGAVAHPDGSLGAASAHFLAYLWALDRGETARAERFLVYAFRHLEQFPAASRPSLVAEAAFFTARFKGEAGSARRLLDTLSRYRGDGSESLVRARAATLLAEGDTEAAIAACDAYLASPGWPSRRPGVDTALLAQVTAIRTTALALRSTS